MTAKVFYSNKVSEVEPHPPRDVQIILQPHPDVGVELVTGADYYVKLNNGCWRGVDIFGLFDYLLDSKIVLFGRMMNNKEYQKLLREAIQEKELWLSHERRP